MWHKPAHVGGDWNIRFANPDTGRGVPLFMADDPASDDWIHPAETFQRRHILVDKPFLAVITTGLDFPSGPMKSDISTLAPQQRFPYPVRANRWPFKARREQVGMARIQFPQHGKDS